MSGFFGVASKTDCVMPLFFGVDYHSHLGTKRGGLAVYEENGFKRRIHSIENSPFRTKFEQDVEEMKGKLVAVNLETGVKKSGIPFSAPSANLSGKPSPTNAQDVFEDMNGRIPLIIDGGECQAGLESTVISVLTETPTIPPA